MEYEWGVKRRAAPPKYLTPITLTIQTSNNSQAARSEIPFAGGASLPVMLSFLLLPLAGIRRARARLRLFAMAGVTVLGLGAVLGLSGCGASNGLFDTPQQSYTVKVTATDAKTGATTSTNVTLTIL
jgi:hypothetical protein